MESPYQCEKIGSEEIASGEKQPSQRHGFCLKGNLFLTHPNRGGILARNVWPIHP
jgi:hypothetical protein